MDNSEIKNEKRHLILGVTGTEVKCMLFDDIADIKAVNPHITGEDAIKAFDILQKQIAEIKEKREQNRENYGRTGEN